ncbi:2-hydroxychromene-2-carboxylate isomerase [Aliikangiella sp. IMCC44359]|uniref:2-hydroxychromene-2-carboxylate isomerase n=1 Tax=Aliikangiella sp. IMCC44359 TaxID=3459125 RepID=UPI00403B0B37
MKLTWYFDFISPFAYLQLHRFDDLPHGVDIEYKPILFAGLLNHWKNVGPAEISPKRIFTYKHCYWYARKNNIPFKMPPAHPFNSLAALRLAIAAGGGLDTIKIIFETIWRHGFELNSSQAIEHLESHLKLSDLKLLISDETVKKQLRDNTEEAASHSVFGVPTFVVNEYEESFWGLDSFDMLLDFIRTPEKFYDEEMRRIHSLPEGVQRKR